MKVIKIKIPIDRKLKKMKPSEIEKKEKPKERKYTKEELFVMQILNKI